MQDSGQQVAFFDLGGAFRLRQLLGPLQISAAGGQLRLSTGGGLALSEQDRATRLGCAWGRDPGHAKRVAVSPLQASSTR